MIISEEDKPLEMTAKKIDVLNSKKYVIVKNHIREIPADKKELNNEVNIRKDRKIKKQSQKGSKSIKYQDKSRSYTEKEHNSDEEDIISNSDLEELRTVYKSCRDVLNRIESKYGHLLNLGYDNESCTKQNNKQKRKLNNELSEHECECTFNKKIIFNEDGEQISTQPNLEKHICHKKLKLNHEPSLDKQTVQIEYEQIDTLPDDLQELDNMLKCDYIIGSDRNKIITKMKTIKQEHLNNIRFDKASLKEKLKSNPDEIIDFRGTNLASLPGYILY